MKIRLGFISRPALRSFGLGGVVSAPYVFSA